MLRTRFCELFDIEVPLLQAAIWPATAPETVAAVSEVDHQDLWQRAALAVVTVSTDEKHADRELAAVAEEIERVEPGLVTRTDVEFLT